MPIEDIGENLDPTSFVNSLNSGFGVKAFLILFLVFYIFFALVMFRQIQLMDKALPNAIAGFLKFVGIVHLGVSIALLFIVIGAF